MSAVQRVLLLLEQRRYGDALAELQQLLVSDAENPFLHQCAARCHLALKNLPVALEHARTAVGLDPEDADGHLLLGHLALVNDKPKQALEAAGKARELDPENPAVYALIAQAHNTRKHWQAGLAAAEQGLGIDPDDESCLALRADALMALGRHSEAAEDVQRNLQLDPEDSYNHANLGWQQLQRGEAKAARKAFLEALRLDADNESARRGLVESIKAANIVYALFFRFLIWMEQLPPKTFFILLIGSVFVRRFAMDLAETNPSLAIPAHIFVWTLFTVFVASMILVPLANLALFVHPIGRHALKAGEKLQASIMGFGLLLAASCLGLFALEWLNAGTLALIGVLLLPPVAAVTESRLVLWSRAALLAICVAGYGAFGYSIQGEYQRQQILPELHKLEAFYEAYEGKPVDDVPAAEMEEMERITTAFTAVRPRIQQNNNLINILLWGLIAFTWVGGFLTKYKAF